MEKNNRISALDLGGYTRWGERKCACNTEGSLGLPQVPNRQPLGGAHSSLSSMHAAGAWSLPMDASLSSLDTWGLGSILTRKEAF